MTTMGEHGQGTITSRKDGRIQVAVTFEDGRVRMRYVPAAAVRRDPRAARREAERLRQELLRERDAELEPTRQTVEGWLRSWIASLTDAKRSRVRPRTLAHYRLIVERHIIPTLGHHRLDRLRERHVQAWLDGDAGAPRTIHHHRAVLRRALNAAKRQHLIVDNPAVGVELPDARWSGAQPLSLEDARALLEATADDRWHALWRLAIDTGCRQAELLALGWDDIDWDEGSVRVYAQLQWLDRQWVRSPTKAARELERIALMPATVEALRSHQRRMAAERQPDWTHWGHLFVTERGRPPHQSEVLKAFKAACRAAGIQERRFHDLRGTSATLLKDLGVAEDVRMARLGHTTTTMARHYAKGGAGLDRAAADRLGEALA
jgi:integrase